MLCPFSSLVFRGTNVVVGGIVFFKCTFLVSFCKHLVDISAGIAICLFNFYDQGCQNILVIRIGVGFGK